MLIGVARVLEIQHHQHPRLLNQRHNPQQVNLLINAFSTKIYLDHCQLFASLDTSRISAIKPQILILSERFHTPVPSSQPARLRNPVFFQSKNSFLFQLLEESKITLCQVAIDKFSIRSVELLVPYLTFAVECNSKSIALPILDKSTQTQSPETFPK